MSTRIRSRQSVYIQSVYIDNGETAWIVEEATSAGLLMRRGDETLRIRFHLPGHPAADFIYADEAARILGITRQHLLRLLRTGTVPGRRVGWRWELKRSEIEALAERRWTVQRTGKRLISKPAGRAASHAFSRVDDRLDEIVAAHQAGATLRELATRYSVSTETVRRLLIAAGVSTRRRSGKPHVLPVDEIVRLYDEQQAIAQIARQYGVAEDTVKRLLESAGVVIRPRADQLAARIAEAQQLYEGGASLRQIAAQFNVRTETVRRWLAATGVETRGRGNHGNYKQLSLPTAELVRLYNDGQSIASLSRRCGVGQATLKRRLVDAGVTIRPQTDRLATRIAEAQQMYESGASLRQIAAQFNVSPKYARQRLAAAGTEIRAERGRKPASVDEMAGLYEEGRSLAYIAEWAGLSTATVRRWLIEANVELRPAGEQSRLATKIAVPIDELIRLYREGYSMYRIAKQYGVSRPTIRRRLIEANVELRPTDGQSRET